MRLNNWLFSAENIHLYGASAGFLFTYIAPLGFVLCVTILKEAYDDFKRWRRDKEVNSQLYHRLTPSGLVSISLALLLKSLLAHMHTHKVATPSSDIEVGHMIVIDTNQRVNHLNSAQAIFACV